jgi:glycosyltransferase involved in cell wall biosynthesis
MRIALLVAGAGGMYCGSCMRDNRLARTLRRQGRDVLLLPLYTPIRTDEENVSESRVYYGGINVYLQHASALYRRMPPLLDRLIDAPAVLRGVGGMAVRTRPIDLGRLTIAVLQGEHGPIRRELRKLIKGLRSLQPDLVNLPNLMFAGIARDLRSALGCSVICTMSGEDIFLDQLPDPFREQAYALISAAARDIDAFIAPTRYYARHMAHRLQIVGEHVHHVPLGIALPDDAPRDAPRDPPPSMPFTIGYFARVCPEKGLDRLVSAFLLLRRARRVCRLRIGGYTSPADRPFLDTQLLRLRAAGFGPDVDVVGEVDHAGKTAFMRSLHVLSVPSRFPEAKGFYVLEALACGVPVVQPAEGSYPELIEATGGGLLFDPSGALGSHDPDSGTALAETLSRLMDEEPLRASLSARGYEATRLAFTDEAMAEQTWSVYERYAAH